VLGFLEPISETLSDKDLDKETLQAVPQFESSWKDYSEQEVYRRLLDIGQIGQDEPTLKRRTESLVRVLSLRFFGFQFKKGELQKILQMDEAKLQHSFDKYGFETHRKNLKDKFVERWKSHVVEHKNDANPLAIIKHLRFPILFTSLRKEVEDELRAYLVQPS